MSLFRIIFVIVSLAAVGGTSYVSWYGYGGESTDVAKSIRQGSTGGGAIAGRIK